jgi:hypothetical protein
MDYDKTCFGEFWDERRAERERAAARKEAPYERKYRLMAKMNSLNAEDRNFRENVARIAAVIEAIDRGEDPPEPVLIEPERKPLSPEMQALLKMALGLKE